MFTNRRMEFANLCLLPLIVTSVIVMSSCQNSTMVTTKGKYALTTRMYRNAMNYQSNTHPYHIMSYKLVRGKGQSAAILYECSSVCWSTPGCVSFFHKPSNGYCYLSRFNKCNSNSNRLDYDAGVHTYELVSSQENASDQVTCLDKCIAEKGCHACGKYYCKGLTCSECNNTCWDINPSGNINPVVYFPPGNPWTLACETKWQLILTGETVTWNELHNHFTMELMVRAYFEGLGTIHSYFESVTFNGKQLTVGNFKEGEGGNGWGAPFSHRIRIQPKNSTCVTFFNPPGECEANGLPSYETQRNTLNYTESMIKRAYYWYTTNENLIQRRITNIKLYVTVP